MSYFLVLILQACTLVFNDSGLQILTAGLATVLGA